MILGISDLQHDTAAVLLGPGGLISAIEEEKLNRVDAGGGLPQSAIEHCLRLGGVSLKELSGIAMAFDPVALARKRNEAGNESPRQSHRDSQGFGELLACITPGVRIQNTPALSFDHHLCHAASAFFPSPFDSALVLTLDHKGGEFSGSICVGRGNELKTLHEIRFPNSLGWFYSQVTALLGYLPGRDEHKVQWLSKEGTPDFLGIFREVFVRDANGLPVLNIDRWLNGDANPGRFPRKLANTLQIQDLNPPRESRLGAQIARSAQDFLEGCVIDLAEGFRLKTGEKSLCVAGGVFLNVLLVKALESRSGFDSVFVQPVAGNPGTALGAAYLAAQPVWGKVERQPIEQMDWGPEYSEEQIKAVLDNCKTIYRYLPGEKQIVEETLQCLQRDKMVAWFQGRTEFGHRALGNRSILASPFSPYVKENLNRYVKHREDFHPFALSVPAEDAGTIFECTENCRFMASVGKLKAGQPELERFCFNGRAVRVHRVDQKVNPRLWSLLRKFGESSPAPVLLNTSFNLFGEPLVCDPRDAVRSFFCSGIDALAMGNFLVVKP